MSQMEASEAREVALARGGDADAFRALFERHARGVFRLAYRITRNAEDAEDVVQETFVKAWRRMDQLDAGATFPAWVHRIAGNCALDLLRRRHRHPEASLQDDAEESPRWEPASADPAPDRLVEGAEVRRRLEVAMSRLSPLERTAFVMRHHEGLSIEEIGAALGSGPSTTKSSIFRAVQKLRRALRPTFQAVAR